MMHGAGSVVDEGDFDDFAKTIVIPGSRAPTVFVPALVNSLLRLVLKYGFKLRSFLHSYLSNQPCPGDQGTRDGSPWPMPIPYPEVFRAGGGGASVWKKRRVSFEILILNCFTLGKPSTCPSTLWLGRRLSAAQWRAVRSLENRSEDLNSVSQ
jgi:hypothetical protein